MIIDDIQSLIKIKIKARDDGILDQYNRLFMVRVLLMATAVCSLNWYTDKFDCIVPGKSIFKNIFKSTNHHLLLLLLSLLPILCA
jgi:hypothetical protein